jgi:hypothetical protein
VPFAETPSRPVVVLPVLLGEGGAALWDSPNPWREAWANRRSSGGLVPFIVPVGDLADLGAVDTQQALTADTASFEKIAQLHGGGDVLVTQARPRAGGAFETTTTRYGAGGGPQGASQTWRANPGESEADLLARAVAGVAASVEEAWKQDNVLRFGQQTSLTVSVPVSSLDDWVRVRERLDGIPAIQRADLLGLNRAEARIELRYVGDPAQLKLALAQRDLVLAEGAPNWTLRPRSGSQRP